MLSVGHPCMRDLQFFMLPAIFPCKFAVSLIGTNLVVMLFFLLYPLGLFPTLSATLIKPHLTIFPAPAARSESAYFSFASLCWPQASAVTMKIYRSIRRRRYAAEPGLAIGSTRRIRHASILETKLASVRAIWYPSADVAEPSSAG